MAVDRLATRGFSMLESLVSLAIAASVMTAYFQAISSSLDLERRARARGQAALLTQELIDQVGFEIALQTGSIAGRSQSGYDWRLTVTEGPSLIAADGRNPPSSARLKQIDVQVAGPDLPNGYRLVTLRVGDEVLR